MGRYHLTMDLISSYELMSPWSQLELRWENSDDLIARRNILTDLVLPLMSDDTPDPIQYLKVFLTISPIQNYWRNTGDSFLISLSTDLQLDTGHWPTVEKSTELVAMELLFFSALPVLARERLRIYTGCWTFFFKGSLDFWMRLFLLCV